MLKDLSLLPFLLLSFLATLLPVTSFSTLRTSEDLFQRRTSPKKNYPRNYNFASKLIEDLIKTRSDAQFRNIKSIKDRYLAAVPRSEKRFIRRITRKNLFL